MSEREQLGKRGRHHPRDAKHHPQEASASKVEEPGKPAWVARRRPISEDDVEPCPICLEELKPEEDEAGRLDWCSLTCWKRH